jgi:hypothetical protein
MYDFDFAKPVTIAEARAALNSDEAQRSAAGRRCFRR